MNIAICEDNKSERAALQTYINDYCERHSYYSDVTMFDSGEALLAAFAPGAFDLIFLDIYLPGMSGVDTARSIRKADLNCLLIFTTNSEDHSMDGFQVNASGYVLKPLSHEQMDAALYMCREIFERNSRLITIPVYGSELKISVAGILYVEVFDKESVLHMKSGTLSARISLDELGQRLGGEPFLRCHRSYIVNMNHVVDLRTDNLLMSNGDAIPMRKNGRKEVRMKMADFIATGRRWR